MSEGTSRSFTVTFDERSLRDPVRLDRGISAGVTFDGRDLISLSILISNPAGEEKMPAKCILSPEEWAVFKNAVDATLKTAQEYVAFLIG